MHDYLLAVRSAEARSESLVCRVDRTARRAVFFRTVGRRCVNGNGRRRPDSLWRPLPAQSRAAVFGLVGGKFRYYSLSPQAIKSPLNGFEKRAGQCSRERQGTEAKSAPP